ncbi:hypothetical protein ACPB9J_12875 [Streptomyces lavendulocolor]|uniref:hypothetical protein n=1 Tax=Streptomyces lavendulocolor TaxID=67316 RepID=UPI003C2E1473
MSSENSTAGRNWATTMMVLALLGLVVAAFGLIPPYWSTFFAPGGRADGPGTRQDAAPPVPSWTAAPRPDGEAAAPAPTGNDAPTAPEARQDPQTSDGPEGGRADAPAEGDRADGPAEGGRAQDEPDAPDDTGARAPEHSGPLNVSIDMGSRGRIGPGTYRRGATPGANTEVYDRTGRIDTGCYVRWELTRAATVVRTHTSERCRPPSITLFNFGDSLDEVGSYRLTADVTTDWGQQGTASVGFTVVAGD